MNCIQPTAPAEETLRLVPKAVSISLIPASTAGPCGPRSYAAAARWYMGIRIGGTPLAEQLEAGSEGIAKAAEGLGMARAPAELSGAGAAASSSSAASGPVPSPALTPPLAGAAALAGGAVGTGGARAVPCCTGACCTGAGAMVAAP